MSRPHWVPEDHFDTWDNADDALRERTIDDYNASGDAVCSVATSGM